MLILSSQHGDVGKGCAHNVSSVVQSLVFPLYDKITPQNIVPSLKGVFKEVSAGIDALEASAIPTWEGLLDPYERLGDRLNLAWGVLSHLQVCPTCTASLLARALRMADVVWRFAPGGWCPPAFSAALQCEPL